MDVKRICEARAILGRCVFFSLQTALRLAFNDLVNSEIVGYLTDGRRSLGLSDLLFCIIFLS